MAPSLPPTEMRDPGGGYVVRKPRAIDAVGGSLRSMYAAEPMIPADLLTLLRLLDAR